MAKSWARSFYRSPEWERVRRAALVRDHGMCQHPGCNHPAQEVHHIIHLTPDNINDATISLNLDNLQSLCRECHMREHYDERVRGVSYANRIRMQHSDILDDITFVDGVPVPLERAKGGNK